MTVQAVMPTFMRSAGDFGLTATAIRSFYETTSGVPLMVVDDASPYLVGVDSLRNLVGGKFPGFSLWENDENVGFSRTVNVGLRAALDRGDDALLVNADIKFFERGWLEAMTAREESVVGALLLYANGLIQHAGIYFSLVSRRFDHIFRFAPGNLALAQKERRCPVTGALQLIKHECLEAVGLYDENFRLGWEDVSYCHDVFTSGRDCVYEPKARAIHHESMFRGTNPSERILQWQTESFRHLHVKHAGLDFSEWCPTLLWDDEPVIC